MKKFFPIIHIIGLPGAGKTTLAQKLAKKLNLPIYCIGKYRSKFPVTPLGEADAWIALFRDLSRRKWRHCILETTGLNCRESFLRVALPTFQMITIKLTAKRNILYAKLRQKKKTEQGNDWLFSQCYRNKFEFIRKLFRKFKRIHADIKIDTNKLGPQEVYRIALKEMKFVLRPHIIEESEKRCS